MLSLSDQYAASTTDAHRTVLLSAGQAMLASNRFTSPNAHPGSGGYMSLLFIAVAGMMISCHAAEYCVQPGNRLRNSGVSIWLIALLLPSCQG
jgi:hypothetical protein